ncbi:hypothetical protein [Methylobacterium trifolii]|uniref:Uncharacterized protein n=1 Tax=Methylobacterium trifolii TaxID=1003092 RepID=A0ABQ4U525_9HYPH|nr:hypothetical protein [Methylobacterium trifolii]GJE61215.1 hypothetical protein MPOCJGCO_3336 [Methylobacterium trifolii]
MGTTVLNSALFKPDDRLQKAAVDHKYHVKNGEQGLYVRRIQYFLYGMGVFHKMYEIVNNDVGPLAASERWSDMTSDLENAYYGNATSYGVWIYKDHYQIIGKGYQTTADDIVGVMTIRHMDAMAKIYFKVAPAASREQMTADAPNALKPAVAAGMGVGSGMLSRTS